MKPLEKITIPREFINDETVTITELYYREGDKVEQGESILSFDSSKADITIEAETSGYIKYFCEVMEEVKVGNLIAEIYEEKFEDYELVGEIKENGQLESGFNPFITKKAKELIKNNNLDLNIFKGSDIINEESVLNVLQEDTELTNTKTEFNGEEESENICREKISVTKKREIDYLSSVQSSGLVTSLTVFVDNPIIIQSFASKLRVMKTSVLPVIVYEVSRLIKKYPLINAYFDKDYINYYKEINIGVGIELEAGLKAVTIYHTDTKSIYEIESEIIADTEKYVNNNLRPEDLQNSTFTISDLFNERVASFIPLINKNQSAVLAIASINEIQGGFNLTLSYDHRVLTGKYAAKFMAELRDRICSYQNTTSTSAANSKLKCYLCKMNFDEDKDFEGLGLIKIQTAAGEKLICSRCLSGWR